MPDDLVTIETFQIPYQADLAKTMLESAGFEAYLIGYEYGRLSFFNTAYAPIRLQVKSSDVVEARRLLDELAENAEEDLDRE